MTKTGKLVTYFAISIAALTASYAAYGASTMPLSWANNKSSNYCA